MRRVPKSGPELSFKPDDAVTFKHGKRENGVEALQGTIEITNNSSRVVNFRWVPWAAKTSKSWLPAATRVAERSSLLLRSQLHLAVVVMGAVVLAAYYALWLAKSRHAPDAPEAARAWIKFRAKANEPSLPAETEAMKCARSLLLTQLLLTVTVVTGACLALWLVKLKRTPDVPDAPSLADRWMKYRFEASMPSMPAVTRATECSRWRLFSQLLFAVVVLFGACLVRCIMKFKRVPDVPDTPSSTDSQVTCGATEIEPWLVAATRTPKYAGWCLRSQLRRAANLSARWLHGSEMLRAVVVMTPVGLTVCYVFWLFKYRHTPYWTDCVTVGNEKYCF
ncbi:uncharacterized protein LOC142590147 isoform X5 [Dermacentor variabilis]|uniref:uncharacterized protein LOC142590147 isoform X5 n=1 Tax=Dermacentor variabilis TaxID=34621 RepID=UPI003F5B6DD9